MICRASLSSLTCSFYEYDPSGRYLTSVTVGNATLEYSYNEDGDLISARDKFGSRKDISYNSNGWIDRIEDFDSNSDPVSCTEYKTSYNGNLDITISPENTTRSLVHDKLGNVVSIAIDGGLPQKSVELPYGRQSLLGDEVSIFSFEPSVTASL